MDGIFRRAVVDSFSQQSNFSTNAAATQGLIGALVLQNSVQKRSDVVVTAAFNITAALGIASGVVYDAYRQWKKNLGYRQQSRFRLIRWIHPAEVFPLVLSTSIIMQGIIFIAVQSMGLHKFSIDDCSSVAQIVWPATWLVATVLLVFGCEVAYRSVANPRFGPRGRWNTPICWTTVIILLILIWIPSKVRPVVRNKCIASLIWLDVKWADFGIVFNSFFVFSYICLGGLISFQLYKTVKVDVEERIAASRMVYYLAVGAILLLFALPFWITIMMKKIGFAAPTAATIALNLFGIINALLHLVLRSNSDKIAIRPPGTAWSRRREWRIFGSADLSLAQQIQDPITFDDDDMKLLVIDDEKRPLPGLRSPYHQDNNAPRLQNPLKSHPAEANAASSAGHKRKPSNYSLFPVEDASPKHRASSYYGDEDSDGLAVPRPLFGNRHRRDSSSYSTATVQIGLRLSHAIAAFAGGGAAARETRPPLPDQFSSDNSLKLPIQRGITPSSSNSTTSTTGTGVVQNARTKPITLPLGDLPTRSDSLNKAGRNRDSWQKDRDARYKTLPPIPPPSGPTTPGLVASPTTPEMPQPPVPSAAPLPSTSTSRSQRFSGIGGPPPTSSTQPRRIKIRKSTIRLEGPRTPLDEDSANLAGGGEIPLLRPTDSVLSPIMSQSSVTSANLMKQDATAAENAEQDSGSGPSWPLREPSGILLPNTAYKPPEKKGWI